MEPRCCSGSAASTRNRIRTLVAGTFSNVMQRPSGVKLWQQPAPMALPSSPFFEPRDTRPDEVQATSYLRIGKYGELLQYVRRPQTSVRNSVGFTLYVQPFVVKNICFSLEARKPASLSANGAAQPRKPTFNIPLLHARQIECRDEAFFATALLPEIVFDAQRICVVGNSSYSLSGTRFAVQGIVSAALAPYHPASRRIMKNAPACTGSINDSSTLVP